MTETIRVTLLLAGISDQELRKRIERGSLCLVDALVSVASQKTGQNLQTPEGLRQRRIDTLSYVDRSDRYFSQEEFDQMDRADILSGLHTAVEETGQGTIWEEMVKSVQFLVVTKADKVLSLLREGKSVIINGFRPPFYEEGGKIFYYCEHCYHILKIASDPDFSDEKVVISNDGRTELLSSLEKELYLSSQRGKDGQVSGRFNVATFF